MNTNEFMGMLITAIAALLGIVSVIVAICVKPIINLNKSITKLNDNIDVLNNSYSNLNARVTKHGEEIDDHEKRILKIEFHERSDKKWMKWF